MANWEQIPVVIRIGHLTCAQITGNWTKGCKGAGGTAAQGGDETHVTSTVTP
eukprot:CAMPEP_0174385756 /NCGR_PEP_ID=MMETSP0811_2-20130205/126822_1 /TAXON_ID=73025 ORGANISM="Eutreptiella gymnastica-like, Strain CCMP1594" /NCGR_SAMPLE_ID=MMETSP0811_2 /ASSEMBLY_ACC=CAM_ASM_000667 /LENGTH=51 /DNA_ID=CAMNT_0015540201 /DNA_START=158 /DNA_END=313 /DNA_ORIENTATION=+